jgi:hypothetical protein
MMEYVSEGDLLHQLKKVELFSGKDIILYCKYHSSTAVST